MPTIDQIVEWAKTGTPENDDEADLMVLAKAYEREKAKNAKLLNAINAWISDNDDECGYGCASSLQSALAALEASK